MIKLVRIDDRLLHGQVALTWTPSLGADSLVVANDKVARDEFQKMTMNLAKPANVKLLIKTVDEAIALLNDEKMRAAKILVLVNSVDDALRMASEVSEIRSVNFGGLRQKEGAKQVSKAISMTDGDIAKAHELIAKDIELEVRQVPTDKKQLLQQLI